MLKIDRIISVSSEDPDWPAESLLKEEGKNKKWKCKTAGEKNATVVVQLEKASKIKSIDVGNKNSAFIEILVGKSCLPDDSYKVLLVASSLMQLKEAKDLSNSNGVRFFKEANFCKPEVNEKWDRIKIVCSQPYNKHVQFGLSFIKFHGETGDPPSSDPTTSTKPNEKKVGTLGRFFMKEEKDDDITAGSIFARRKELQSDEKTSAVAIRAATSQLLAKDEPTSNTYNKASPARVNHADPSSSKAAQNSARKTETGKRNKPHHDSSDSPEAKKARKAAPVTNNPDQSNQDTASSNKKTPIKPSAPIKRKKYKPFSEFMRGVIFTISGFQNPLRGDIRNKALQMGAKYKADWDNTCTHLVCAFTNTPKFNQVKGQGKIVKKDWIEICYSKRIRLPWRRFALDPPDARKSESEEEIFEGDESLNNVADSSSSNGSSTTQQERQPGPSLFDLPQVKPKKKKNQADNDDPEPPSTPKKRTPKKSPAGKVNNVPTPTSSSNNGITNNGASSSKTVYLDLDLERLDEDSIQGVADTDSEQDWMDEMIEDEDSSLPLPYLPQQFNDLSFYIADDFSAAGTADLKRYILAHNGNIQEDCSDDTEYVIADNSSTVSELKENFPQIIGVKAEWVWRCHDENKLMPTSNFEL